MRVAILTSDNREAFKDYENPWPIMGFAPGALLKGFAMLPDEAEIHVVSCLQKPAAFPEKIGENIWYHGLVVPKFGWLRTAYQGCIRATRNALRTIRPDIVHGQGTERDCAICAVSSGFPNVVTVHGNMRLIARVNHARPFSFHWFAALLERFTIPRSDGVVCITNYTRQAVGDLAQKTWIVPNAVDWEFSEAERRPVEPPVCLCVGTICARKNQVAFIKALDPLAAARKFKLVFLGEANRNEPYCAEFFEALKERPWCQYAGFESGYKKLKPYFETASVVALPSLEDNCPMVVLEAMTAGIPVVAANVGGVPDLIEHGRTGLLCDPLNPQSMRDAVEKILANPDLGPTLAKDGKSFAQERFHPSAVARSHLEIYKSVIKQKYARQ